ncbi:hypothetical protein AG1IA_07681 [Rhizoctonia solani AG-1 IA]|uniref:Uncharacterized protein n=1 Tax=Thanatephorus cucumeris (strain AG1-IA) TaxID=983506 RepID=L8WNH0_THACA|nr:hypothetical protein AG1IA_07681 [Rhizoctonia solani AG-1 IA]
MHHTLYFVTLLACLSGIVSGISAPRAEAKSTTCKLQVLQSSTPRGYISSKRNESGEYGILTNSSTEAIEVTFTPKNTSTQMDLSVTGANVNTPALGASKYNASEGWELPVCTVGIIPSSCAELKANFSYAYIGLTSRTPSGAVPQTGVNSFDQVQNYNRKIESAIWSFNSSTKSVTPQWVNTDHVLIITGDKGKFGETFKEEFEAQGATPVEVDDLAFLHFPHTEGSPNRALLLYLLETVVNDPAMADDVPVVNLLKGPEPYMNLGRLTVVP